MDIKELIEKAVESLNRARQLNLNITGTLSLSDDVFSVLILDNESGCTFDATIDKNISNQQLLPDDPTNLSPDDIIMLRIAKRIFEAYKKSKNNIIDNAIDEVDELKNKVKNLEDINNKLTNEIYCLRAALQAKGIL